MEYLIKTPCGTLRGTATKKEGVIAYKGIRYATAGRFEYPTEVTSWEGIYDATEYGACAYQPRSFYNEEENLKKIEEHIDEIVRLATSCNLSKKDIIEMVNFSLEEQG